MTTPERPDWQPWVDAERADAAVDELRRSDTWPKGGLPHGEDPHDYGYGEQESRPCDSGEGLRPTPPGSLRAVRYRTIVADPPWPYKTPGGGPLQSSPTHRPNSWTNDLAGVGSVKRYGAMSLNDICEIKPPAEANAHLYLWTTNAFIAEAHDVARAWGFRPITVCTWVKTKPDGSPSMKTGYYFRGATEHFLFCVRGSLRLQTTKAYPTAFLWPRAGSHSSKPDVFYDLVEECSPGPYLELFSCRERVGWAAWGAQAINPVELAS